MDNDLLNETEEEEKKEQKEMEQEEKEEKAGKDFGEENNPMPEQSSDSGETADGETADDETADGETEGGETEEDEDDTWVGKLAGKADPYVDDIKQKGDSLFESGMDKSRYYHEKYKDIRYGITDSLKNLGDDIHYGKKALWKNIKTGASKVKNAVGKAASSTKLGKWIIKKKEERAAKEAAQGGKKPGFFSKAWTALKTGAAKIKGKLQNSKFGKWIQKKKEEKAAKKAAEAGKPKKPNFFGKIWNSVKTGVSNLKDAALNTKLGKRVTKEVAKGKEWVNSQMQWVNDKKAIIQEELARRKEEDEIHDHQRRIARESREDPEYGKRYKELVDELKQNEGIKELQGSIDKNEVDSFMDDIEAGKEPDSSQEEASPEAAGDNPGTAQPQVAARTEDAIQPEAGKTPAHTGKRTMHKVAGAVNTLSSAASYLPKVTKKVTKTAAIKGSNLGQAFGSLLNLKGNAENMLLAEREQFDKEELAKDPDIAKDPDMSRILMYQTQKLQKDKQDIAFNSMKESVTGLGHAVAFATGNDSVNYLSSAINLGIEGAHAIASNKLDKQTRKMGLKGIIGGVEGYKALKEKYKMKAPEMRYAMKEALGLRSEEDVINADRRNLVDKMFARKDAAAGKTRGNLQDKEQARQSLGMSSSVIHRSSAALSKKTESAPATS